jgi:hypothetical protein
MKMARLLQVMQDSGGNDEDSGGNDDNDDVE